MISRKQFMGDMALAAAGALAVPGALADDAKPAAKASLVYMTKTIAPEGLARVYEALKKPASGKVAVKLSTGEPGGHNYLSPALIAPLVKAVNGTIVECNTAYNGKRSSTAEHRKAAADHGFTAIAPVDIMDAEGDAALPVAGKTKDPGKLWNSLPAQDDFLESMAEAAKAVSDHCKGRILYISVMNHLSVDCDCDAHPAAPKMADIGVLASLDPVALDRACVDLVVNSADPGKADLIERINSRHGTHTLDYAEEIGLGVKRYALVSLDGTVAKLTAART